jgi:hypothetical protein
MPGGPEHPKEVMMKAIRLVILTGLLSATGCDRAEPTTPIGPVLTVWPRVLELSVGETKPLQVGRAGIPGTVVWSSSDPAIARVDSAGAVTGVAPGSTKVQATLGHYRAGADVHVAGN